MSDLVRILKLMPLVKDLPIFDCNQYGDAVVESKAIPPNLIQSGRFFTLLGYQVELWRFQGVKGVEVVVHPWVSFEGFFCVVVLCHVMLC